MPGIRASIRHHRMVSSAHAIQENKFFFSFSNGEDVLDIKIEKTIIINRPYSFSMGWGSGFALTLYVVICWDWDWTHDLSNTLTTEPWHHKNSWLHGVIQIILAIVVRERVVAEQGMGWDIWLFNLAWSLLFMRREPFRS